MKFTLIICTYMRPKPLWNLLESVKRQSKYPDEILIVDGSTNAETEWLLQQNPTENLTYFSVPPEHRGLTRQRNYGIRKVAKDSEFVCFLDDDTELDVNYFKEVITTFRSDDTISGVGGVAINENNWKIKEPNKKYQSKHYFQQGNYILKEGQRNVIRNYLGLNSPYYSGIMPLFSHGRSCSFPLDGQTYEVDLLIGMSMSFRRDVLEAISFSNYFEGYGLYEDADFSLRALQFGRIVVNTKAQLSHYHDASGRPNQYQYGKMVVRNGWYVWRVKNPHPKFKDRIKWHAITVLLTLIRATNTITTKERKAAFTETLGRIVGWWSLWFRKPKLI